MTDKSQNGLSDNRNNPTSAEEWGEGFAEGYVIPLPSGKKARVRTLQLDQLMAEGTIPDFLTPVASKTLWVETESDEIGNDSEMSKNFLKLMNLIIPLAMVSPKVVTEIKNRKEEITLKMIEFHDKVAIFNLAIQPSIVLRTFSEQQAEGMADLRDIQNHIEQTK